MKIISHTLQIIIEEVDGSSAMSGEDNCVKTFLENTTGHFTYKMLQPQITFVFCMFNYTLWKISEIRDPTVKSLLFSLKDQ